MLCFINYGIFKLVFFFLKANDTLDLSSLTIDDLKKAVDVPKELRSNQGATLMYQMDEIRKLVSFDLTFQTIEMRLTHIDFFITVLLVGK